MSSFWTARIRAYRNTGVQGGLMLFAFLLPFARLNHILEYLFLGLVLVWLATTLAFEPVAIKRTPVDVPILLFLGWILITTATAVDSSYSFAEWRKTLPRVLMFFFVVHAVHDVNHVRNIVLACVLGAALQGVTTVHEILRGGIGWLDMTYRVEAWANSSQWLSVYFIMVIPFCYLIWASAHHRALRWVSLAGAAVCLTGLFLTHTRAAWVALIIQMIVWVSLRLTRRAAVAGGLAAAVVALVMVATALPGTVRQVLMQGPVTNTSSMIVRFNTWSLALDHLADRPLTGLGYGKHSFRQVIPEDVQVPLHAHIHNTFLSTAVQVGLPGLFLLIWVFAAILKSFLETWRRHPDSMPGQMAMAVLLCTVGVIVRNLFDDMFVGTLVYLFWLLIGLGFALIASSVETQMAASGAPHQEPTRTAAVHLFLDRVWR